MEEAGKGRGGGGGGGGHPSTHFQKGGCVRVMTRLCLLSTQ